MSERRGENPDFGKDQLKFSIGRISPDRWQEYRDLRLQALEEEPIAFEDPVVGRERLEARSEEEWRKMLSGSLLYYHRGENLILGAEADGKLIGTINAVMAGDMDDALIQNVYTAKDYRGKNVGRQLFESLMAEIKSRPKIKRARLQVVTTQEPAINLYKSFGFKIRHKFITGRKYQGEKLEGYEMNLELNQ